MPSHEDPGEFRFNTLLTVSPRLGTTVFDFVSIFVKRAILERAGYKLHHGQLEKGPDNDTLVRLMDVTVEIRDVIVQALRTEGYGVAETPIFTIAAGDESEERVA